MLSDCLPNCLPDILPQPCAQGQCLPLASARLAGGFAAHQAIFDADQSTHQHTNQYASPIVPLLPAGTLIYSASTPDTALFQVTGLALLPAAHGPHALRCPLLTALRPILTTEAAPLRVHCAKKGRSLAWVTLSDKGSQGLRHDLSGPALAELVAQNLPIGYSQGFLLPDDAGPLRALLARLALEEGYDLIITTGGTGLSPRDVAPQVTASLLDMPLPGFTQAMLAASLAKTPHAVISRAMAGVLGASIIVNLPGSHKAALENLAAILPALPHALDKLHGDPADCGG